MSLKEELPIPIEDLRRRVLHVEPDFDFLKLFENFGDEVFKAMLDQKGLERWRIALKKAFIDPIVSDIDDNFKGQTGIRFGVVSFDGQLEAPFQSSSGDVSWVNLVDIETLLEAGVDRPGKTYLEIVLVDCPEIIECAIYSFSKILLSYYFGAASVNRYEQSILSINPVICVYDLSLLRQAPGKKDFLLPSSSEVRRQIIRAVYPFDVTPLLPQEL